MAVSPAKRQVVRQRAESHCEYCHADERWQFIRFTLDHIVPQSAGGDDSVENLALACRNCNERRSNHCEALDPESRQLVPLFDPRRQTWEQHFAWSANRIQIVGVTPIGRATVELLDMNDDRHDGVILRIRQRDLEDGFHPPNGDPILPT